MFIPVFIVYVEWLGQEWWELETLDTQGIAGFRSVSWPLRIWLLAVRYLAFFRSCFYGMKSLFGTRCDHLSRISKRLRQNVL